MLPEHACPGFPASFGRAKSCRLCKNSALLLMLGLATSFEKLNDYLFPHPLGKGQADLQPMTSFPCIGSCQYALKPSS